MNRGRLVLVAGHAAVFLLGVALGVWGTFLIPLRLPGGIEGLSVVIALVGNLVVGWLASRGLGTVLAAALPGIGWLLTVIVLGGGVPRPEGDVLIPGSFAGDPGVGTVSLAFMVGGAIGTVLAVTLAGRRRPTPTPPG